MRWLFMLLLFFVVSPVLAHPQDEFPQVTLQIDIADDAVELIVGIPARDAKLTVFEGLSPVDMDRMEPEELAEVIAPVFAERCPVRIDGVVVPPVILGPVVEMRYSKQPARRFPERQVLEQGTLKFAALYETKGKPRQVAFDWSIFANLYDDENRPVYRDDEILVASLVTAEDKEHFVFFTPLEPGYTWHSSEAAEAPTELVLEPTIKRGPKRVLWELPLGIMLVGGLATMGVWRRNRHGRWVVPAVSVLLAGGAFSTISGATYVEPPADAEALAVFESLHRNIYRAFDYTDEGLVYDALSQSVHGPMLETIYNDVYQSLIMREENGAVSKVVRVQIDEAKILPPEAEQASSYGRGSVAYRVHAKWQVDGVVTHFDHTHARTNAFEAVYTVASIASDWRIVDAEILQQERIDDGQQGAGDLQP